MFRNTLIIVFVCRNCSENVASVTPTPTVTSAYRFSGQMFPVLFTYSTMIQTIYATDRLQTVVNAMGIAFARPIRLPVRNDL